jgi:hypothetical protein
MINESASAIRRLRQWVILSICMLLSAACLYQAFANPSAAHKDPISSQDAVNDMCTKRIEDIRAGDQVLAYDVTTRQWLPKAVLQPMVHDYQGDLVCLKVGGQTLQATTTHPFWVVSGKDLQKRPAADHVPETERQTAARAGDGRWVDAAHLQVGDVLLVCSGDEAAVEDIHFRRAEQKVYNLEVADLHTYAVGIAGVLVHNCQPGPPIPRYVYRGGSDKDTNLFPRPQDGGMLSGRDSISNPWPKIGLNPPLPKGAIQIIDTTLLGDGKVIPDGAPYGTDCPGHISIGPNVPAEEVRNAIIQRITHTTPLDDVPLNPPSSPGSIREQ